jgi:hypothetical protein
MRDGTWVALLVPMTRPSVFYCLVLAMACSSEGNERMDPLGEGAGGAAAATGGGSGGDSPASTGGAGGGPDGAGASAVLDGGPGGDSGGAPSAGGGPNGGFGGCVLTLCEPTVQLAATLDVTFATIRRYSLQVCREALCATPQLSTLYEGPTLPDTPKTHDLTLESAVTSFEASAELSLQASGGAHTISVSFRSLLLNWINWTEGDVFSLIVLDEAGDYVTGLRKRAMLGNGGMCGSCTPVVLKDEVPCCPAETQPGGPYLGGAQVEGSCPKTHDFECSQNWRLEPDSDGCPEWRYDVDESCGRGDAGVDAGGQLSPGHGAIRERHRRLTPALRALARRHGTARSPRHRQRPPSGTGLKSPRDPARIHREPARARVPN